MRQAHRVKSSSSIIDAALRELWPDDDDRSDLPLASLEKMVSFKRMA